jgi:O-antigen/teichoic acid export membrane protein
VSEAPPSLRARTARGAGWTAALRVLVRGLGFVSTLILARFLAPGDFGLVALALAAQQAIDTLAFIGVDEALIRAPAPDRGLYDTGFTLNVLRGLTIGLLLAAAAWPAAAFFGEPRLAWVLVVLGISVAIEGFANVGLVDFWRAMDFGKEVRLTVLPRLAGAVLAIGIAAGLHSYWALVAAVLLQRVLRVVISYRMHPYRPHLSLAARGTLLGYSAWSAALSGAVVLRDRAGIFLMARLLDSAGLGVFTVGWDIASTPTSELVAPLSRAAYSGFAAAQHAGDDVAETYLRVAGMAGLLIMPLGFGLSLTAAPLVRLAYGAAWTDAIPVVQILGAVGGSTVFGYLAWTVVYAHARLSTCFAITLAAALLRIVLLVVLMPAFGVAGAAWATAASLGVESALYLVRIVRDHGVAVGGLLRCAWRTVVGVGAMIAVLYGYGLGWAPAPGSASDAVAQLSLALPLGAVVYAMTVSFLWFLSGRPGGAEADSFALMARLVVGRRDA